MMRQRRHCELRQNRKSDFAFSEAIKSHSLKAGLLCRAMALRAMTRSLRFALVALVLSVSAAHAHPHVWVTSSSEVVYGTDGAITGIRHTWKFDDMFSTYALQDIQNKTKGVYTREELAPLAQINVESLKEFGFFTFVKSGSSKETFVDPVDYFLEYKDSALVLHFTLPFKSPVKTKNLQMEIYDPSYFVGFDLTANDAVKLAGAPANCKTTVNRPDGKMTNQAPLSEQSFVDGTAGNVGAMFSNTIKVDCP